jgi:branched-chain amino acid aminotransferase
MSSGIGVDFSFAGSSRINGQPHIVTPVSEIAQWKFKPGAISEQLMKDYTAEVQPKGKAAAA